MENNKIWKLYDDKSNTFSIQSFETNKDLTSYWGYDFIYNEIYNWEFSQTGCIYEMFDCLIKPNGGDDGQRVFCRRVQFIYS